MNKYLTVVLVSVFIGAVNMAHAEDHRLKIQEWEVPWEQTRPRDPYVGPDGMVWFVGQVGHYVARFNPETEEFKKYPLAEGTGPHNLIVDEDGAVWYAGNRAAHIGKLNPETGEIHKIPMPDERARDPHTLVFDGAGDIWFTVQGGNFVGKLEVDTEKVHLIEVPTEGARPYGIKVDGDTVWVALLGTYKLAKVDAEQMTLREIPLPRKNARPRRLEVTSDGHVWYVDYAQGKLGRLDPSDNAIREWNMPSGEGSAPYGTASDDRDRLWIVETGVQPNQFVGFDTEEKTFFTSEPVPSGGGTVRYMYYHQPTQSVWFGADTNTVGRASLPE